MGAQQGLKQIREEDDDESEVRICCFLLLLLLAAASALVHGTQAGAVNQGCPCNVTGFFYPMRPQKFLSPTTTVVGRWSFGILRTGFL